jgi:hypothetical protein
VLSPGASTGGVVPATPVLVSDTSTTCKSNKCDRVTGASSVTVLLPTCLALGFNSPGCVEHVSMLSMSKMMIQTCHLFALLKLHPL